MHTANHISWDVFTNRVSWNQKWGRQPVSVRGTGRRRQGRSRACTDFLPETSLGSLLGAGRDEPPLFTGTLSPPASRESIPVFGFSRLQLAAEEERTLRTLLRGRRRRGRKDGHTRDNVLMGRDSSRGDADSWRGLELFGVPTKLQLKVCFLRLWVEKIQAR